MCGILGIVGRPGVHVNQILYDGLTVLQHRGQDAAGMLTEHDGQFILRKSNGQVADVFDAERMSRLLGSMASVTSDTRPLGRRQARRPSPSTSTHRTVCALHTTGI